METNQLMQIFECDASPHHQREHPQPRPRMWKWLPKILVCPAQSRYNDKARFLACSACLSRLGPEREFAKLDHIKILSTLMKFHLKRLWMTNISTTLKGKCSAALNASSKTLRNNLASNLNGDSENSGRRIKRDCTFCISK